MLFTSTLQKLQIQLAAVKTTLDCPIQINYEDNTTPVFNDNSFVNTNGTTVTDILPPSLEGITRKITEFSLFNIDTGPITVYVIYNDNGTSYRVLNATLQIGDTLGYTNANGWYSLDINGNLKSSYGTGTFAALAGLSTQQFSVAAATAAAHAVRADQLSANLTTFPKITTGTFTGTLTGCTTSPTCTFRYTMIGDVVTISMLESSLGATSNTGSKTFTGMPAAIQPTTATVYGVTRISDNGGTYVAGLFSINTSGVIQAYVNIGGSGSWTTSGTATIGNITFTYVR